MSKRRVIINVSDAKVSNDPSDVLVTYSLGSCIGICLYDSATKVGGMLHYQLPSSKMDPERARAKPFMFCDTGLKFLLEKLTAMGAKMKRMQIRLAGGASMDSGPKGFDIGKRNHLAVRKLMWQNGMFIDSEDVGGFSPRNVYMDMADGVVTVRSNGLEKRL
ncbi:MAG: chemotaxis protein CheD [Planctomycetota bacterium]